MEYQAIDLIEVIRTIFSNITIKKGSKWAKLPNNNVYSTVMNSLLFNNVAELIIFFRGNPN